MDNIIDPKLAQEAKKAAAPTPLEDNVYIPQMIVPYAALLGWLKEGSNMAHVLGFIPVFDNYLIASQFGAQVQTQSLSGARNINNAVKNINDVAKKGSDAKV